VPLLHFLFSPEGWLSLRMFSGRTGRLFWLPSNS
jgi:hypothetical protein